jgi:hypothetical protein
MLRAGLFNRNLHVYLYSKQKVGLNFSFRGVQVNSLVNNGPAEKGGVQGRNQAIPGRYNHSSRLVPDK